MTAPRYPSLFQVNTRVWLTALSRSLGRRATLDDVPDAEIDRWAELGFDWIWLLSVWQTGEAGRNVSLANQEWRRDFERTLSDLVESDIGGSGFAITAYQVDARLGGDAALARLRRRLESRGIKLMLDFVPNHVALDHPWATDHPEYLIEGTELDLARAPGNYTWVRRDAGDLLLAYGRDPYFPGWPDTLQLNYGHAGLREAMMSELDKIASRCDGVRCDMAMLILPEVFERTWGIRAAPFWPTAIRQARARRPDFMFMAEVYWDLEWELEQQGFDYTYDKRLYDRLRAGRARPVREHLMASLEFQDHSARFLENHDEPRAAATFPHGQHEAAAVITYLSPGLRFFQQGQFDGHHRRISPHLVRGPEEATDPQIKEFYARLLQVLSSPVLRNGEWQLVEATPAWPGNWTQDCIVTFAWHLSGHETLLISVNYAPNQSQCYVKLGDWCGRGPRWRLEDQLADIHYDRDGVDLAERGLYLDLAPWQAHVFSLRPLP